MIYCNCNAAIWVLGAFLIVTTWVHEFSISFSLSSKQIGKILKQKISRLLCLTILLVPNLDLGARNRKEEALMTRQLHRIVQQSKDCGEKDSEQCVSTFGNFWTRMVTSEVAGICQRLNFQECLDPKSLHITPAVSHFHWIHGVYLNWPTGPNQTFNENWDSKVPSVGTL